VVGSVHSGTGDASPYPSNAGATAAFADRTITAERPALAATVRRYGEAVTLIAILTVAAVARLLWLRWFPMPPESDFATFLDMATKISHGAWRPDEYGWVYQGSGYPTLIAPLIALGGGLDALRLVNVAAQLLMVSGVWLLARRLFGPRGAAVAGALAAVMPGLWSYVPLLAAESVAMMPLVAVALLLRPSASLWQSGALGVAVGMLAFTRPSFLPFVLLVLVATLFLTPAGRWWARWQRPLLFVAGLLLVATPVMALNVTNGGPPLPSGAAGWQTWLVNNEHATGAWFDASADDAYPFAGLTDADETRAAQSKLGVQFVVANPRTAAEAMLDRYHLNWQSDAMGIDWTFDRAPEAWQNRVPFASHLKGVAQVLYVLALVLAAVAAVRHRSRVALLLPVVLPLGYAMAILAVAEANARYHAMFVPLICVMAGGALVPADWSTRRVVRPKWWRRPGWSGSTDRAGSRSSWLARLTAVALLGVVAVLLVLGFSERLWERWRFSLPPWLVAVVVLVPLVGCALAQLATHWQRIVAWAARPSWRWPAVAGFCALITLLPVWTVVAGVDQRLTEIAAVSPSGWERTIVPAGGAANAGTDPEAASLPLLLQDSGTAPPLRQVSFPDAVLLQFDAASRPGDVVRLTRTLTNIHVGEAYVFYLQVYDPGLDGDPTERLTITLNGGTVWERPPGGTEPAEWRYVRVDWTADTTALTMTVSRTAGQGYDPGTTATPRVRTLHLYPQY